MAWRFVKQPNGLLARFSEVVDAFTHYNMTQDQAVVLCVNEYEMQPFDGEEKVRRAELNEDRWAEALGIVERVHGLEKMQEVLVSSGCAELVEAGVDRPPPCPQCNGTGLIHWVHDGQGRHDLVPGPGGDDLPCAWCRPKDASRVAKERGYQDNVLNFPEQPALDQLEQAGHRLIPNAMEFGRQAAEHMKVFALNLKATQEEREHLVQQILDSAKGMAQALGVDLVLTEVFSGVGIRTEDGHLFGIAQRDTGLEITCPDGTLVGVKLDEEGKTFVDRNCKVLEEGPKDSPLARKTPQMEAPLDFDRPDGPRSPRRTPKWIFGNTLRTHHGFVGSVDSIYVDYYAARCSGVVPRGWFELQEKPPSTKDQIFYGLVALDGKGAVLVGEAEVEEA